ncbi:hypothetical protein B7494_g7102 [Chlorociboria aeruginascens]|nr:hypothetical protein B7494_g7102 [Chlorociboria aeruginascens]
MTRTKKHMPGGGFRIDSLAKKRCKLAKKHRKLARKYRKLAREHRKLAETPEKLRAKMQPEAKDTKDTNGAKSVVSKEQEGVMVDTLTDLSSNTRHNSNPIIGKGDTQKLEIERNSKVTAFQKFQGKKGQCGLISSRSTTIETPSAATDAKIFHLVADKEAKLLAPVSKNDVDIAEDGVGKDFEEWSDLSEDEGVALEMKNLSLDSTIVDSTMENPNLSTREFENEEDSHITDAFLPFLCKMDVRLWMDFWHATSMESDARNNAFPIDAPRADTTMAVEQAQTQGNIRIDVMTTITITEVEDSYDSPDGPSPRDGNNPLVGIHQPSMHAAFPASDSNESFRLVNETKISVKRSSTPPTLKAAYYGIGSPGSMHPSIEEADSPTPPPRVLRGQDSTLEFMARRASTPSSPGSRSNSFVSSLNGRNDGLQFINLPPRYPANAGLNYPRIVDLSSWSEQVDITQFSMADGITTLLWQLNRTTMTEFFDFHRVLRLRATWPNDDGQPDLVISRVARRVTVGIANKDEAELMLSLKYDIQTDGKWVLCAGRSRAEGIDENDCEGLNTWCFTIATGFIDNRIWEHGVWKKNGFEFAPRQQGVRWRSRPSLERKKARDNLNSPLERHRNEDLPLYMDVSSPTINYEDIYQDTRDFQEQMDACQALKELDAMQKTGDEERKGG